jgi:hypothetical protein
LLAPFVCKTEQMWSQENGQKDKQRSTKHTHKTKDRLTRTPVKQLSKSIVVVLRVKQIEAKSLHFRCYLTSYQIAPHLLCFTYERGQQYLIRMVVIFIYT